MMMLSVRRKRRGRKWKKVNNNSDDEDDYGICWWCCLHTLGARERSVTEGLCTTKWVLLEILRLQFQTKKIGIYTFGPKASPPPAIALRLEIMRFDRRTSDRNWTTHRRNPLSQKKITSLRHHGWGWEINDQKLIKKKNWNDFGPKSTLCSLVHLSRRKNGGF